MEDLDLGVDPTFWLDQDGDGAPRDDFETLWAGDSRALGTQYTSASSVYSHYAIPGWAAWQDYEYRGRMKLTDAAGGIGVAFYSRRPAGGTGVYVLRRFDGTPEEDSLHLVAFGTTLTGDLQTGVTPQAGTWYRFQVQAATEADRVTLPAKVWAEGISEPGDWRAHRRRGGGRAHQRRGAKYFGRGYRRPLQTAQPRLPPGDRGRRHLPLERRANGRALPSLPLRRRRHLERHTDHDGHRPGGQPHHPAVHGRPGHGFSDGQPARGRISPAPAPMEC